MRDGRPELFRLPEVNFVDDGAGKPVGINDILAPRRCDGRSPHATGHRRRLQHFEIAVGIAEGGDRAAADVFAYDRNTPFGRLDKAMDAAALNKWTVVDMKNDWKRIFAFE
jgi:hypothetical protein